MLWFSDSVIDDIIVQRLLEAIINFRLPLSKKEVCFNDLRDKVKVVFSDEKIYREEPVSDLSALKQKIKEINDQIAETNKKFHETLDRKREIEKRYNNESEQFVNNPEYRHLKEQSRQLEQMLGQLYRAENKVLTILKEGKNITYILGEFRSSPEPTVIIYYNNFDTSGTYFWCILCPVFIHEMFHAWYYFEAGGHDRQVLEVDEPMVEFSTLYFLNQLVQDIYHISITEKYELAASLEWQKSAVLSKQTAYGSTASYGFGRFIYNSLVSSSPDKSPLWIEAYSNKCASISPSDSISSRIAKALNPSYPFSNENSVFKDFHSLLFGKASSQRKKASSAMTFRDLLQACLKILGKKDFNLGDIYKFKPVFEAAYPANANIEAKIRQTLQQLESDGVLTRIAKGIYHIN